MPRGKGPGSGGARGGEGEPVWSRTRPSRDGDPGRTAPGAASGRYAPDGLDELRLGRPRLAMGRGKVWFFAVLTSLLYGVPLVGRLTSGRPPGPWPSSGDSVALFLLSVYAGSLASGRCERDVRAGRPARWAYGWDWAQLVLLAANCALLLWFASPASYALLGLMLLSLLTCVHQASLRRRRARAVWTTDAVRKAFE